MKKEKGGIREREGRRGERDKKKEVEQKLRKEKNKMEVFVLNSHLGLNSCFIE